MSSAPGAIPAATTRADRAQSAGDGAAPFGDRRGGGLRRAVPVAAPVVPLVLAAWLVLASVPIGGPGGRALIWLGALAAPLCLLLWISAGLVLGDLARYRPRYATPATVWLTVAAWFGALCLGFFLPDLIDGRGQSLFTALAGPEAVGLSAGFANTVGVLTFAAAAGSVVSASLDVRRTRARLRGEAVEPDPEEEDRLRQEWVDSFRASEAASRRDGGPR